MKRDLYSETTDRILAQMESGVLPWQRGWSAGGSRVPMNAISNRPYSGINVLLFWMAADAGYASPRYLTFKQAKAAGGHVRKDEKATRIFFFKSLTVKDKATEEDKTIPMLREYYVFNVAQCDGLPESIVHGPGANIVRNQDQREADADAFIKASGADFREGVGKPCYIPSRDFISMPAFDSFASKTAFYGTAFHELTHWTGAKHRLDRDFKKRFEEHERAAEELVAELGAAFLNAEFGFDETSNNAAYLASWIELLKSDKRAIFTAASQASKAAEYLRGLALAEPVAIAA